MNLETSDLINLETDWEVNMFCTICVQKLQKETTKSITTLLDNSIKAYEFLELMSKFKFMVNGPQLVCTSCFDKILVAFKLHKMCNQAQEQFEQYLTYCENLNLQYEDSIIESSEVQHNDTDEIENKVEMDIGETNIQVSNNQEITMEHTKEKSLKCNICGASSKNKTSAKIHQLVHQPIEPVQCKLCSKTIKTKGHLIRHEKYHTLEDGRKLKCSHCEYRCHYKASMKIHERLHTGERPFTCEVCSMSFVARISLKRHMRVHSEDSFKCRYCNKLFIRQLDDWLKHEAEECKHKPSIIESTEIQQNNTDSIENKVEMDIGEANIQVSNNQGMASEEINVVKKKRNSDGIKIKRKLKITKPKPIYQCNICLETFSGTFTRDEHIRRLHTGERPFMCDICGNSFFTNSCLKTHKVVHETMRPWKCKLCPKTFQCKFRLGRHVVIHTEERNFKCSQCNQSFKLKRDLKSHEVFHGQRKYKCEVCSKSFFTSGKLKRHMSVHTGEKPYACSYCDSRFTTRHYWTVHEAKHSEQQKKS